MDRTYDAFISSIKNSNTQAVYKHYAKIAEYDLSDHSFDNLNTFIMGLSFSSIRDYSTFMNAFKAFAKYLEDMRLLMDLEKINIDDARDRIRSSSTKRYLTHDEYLDLLHVVEVSENFNELFYVTMFMCIYEGLFAEGFRTLAELRKQDVDGTTVTLHFEDGTTHKIEVSLTLAQNLIELADCKVWERFGRYGNILTMQTEGHYPDSVFKIASRASKSNKVNIEAILMRKYSKLRNDYGFPSNPSQLFYSGMIHRASIACKEQTGLDYIEIFNDLKYRQLVNSLINNELIRCRYATNYDVLRYNIADNIGDFRTT